MRKKSLLCIFMLVVSLFVLSEGVKAANLTTSAFFSEVQLRNESELIREKFYIMKDTDGDFIYCLNMASNFPGNNVSLELKTEKIEDGKAYAYIIKNVSKIKRTPSNKSKIVLTSGSNAIDLESGENEDYVKAQLAIWYYQQNKITEINGSDITSKIKEIYTGIEELVAEAETKKDTLDPKVTISSPIEFSFSKTENLYVSNPITITSNSGDISVVTLSDGINVQIFDESGKEVDKIQNGQKIILKFKKTERQLLNLSGYLEATVTGSVYEMNEYKVENGAANLQTLGKLTTSSKTVKAKENFTIKNSTTKFSKISVVNQKELPGATLRILDENKEPLKDESGNLYEWVSTDEPHYIEGLPAGKYYLQEIIAPEGYVLSDEIVEFEVKDDGSITEVIMENDLEVEVPDTLSSRSILLLVIGMIDIALGIGILLYVKKNKATE